MLKILLLSQPLKDRAENPDDAFLRAVWLYVMSIATVSERVVGSAARARSGAKRQKNGRHRAGATGLPDFRPGLIVLLGVAPVGVADAIAATSTPVLYVPVPSRSSPTDLDRSIGDARVSAVWLSAHTKKGTTKKRRPSRRISILPAAASSPALSRAADAALGKLGVRTLSKSRLATLARNLLSEVALEATVFNPYTRLLTVDVRVRARIPAAFLHGEFVFERASVPNAWAMTLSYGFDHVHLNGDAILPADVEPANVRFEIFAWGTNIAAIDLPRSPPRQRSGLIGVDLTGNAARVLFWADDPRCRLRCGTHISTVPPRSHGGARVYESTVQWPFNNPTLETDAVDGCGQSFPQLREWGAAKPVNSSRLLEMKDIHAGQTAWIVGNGPSVRTDDLDRLEGRLTFCFNRFHLAYDRTALRPTYTVTADQQMIDDFGSAIVAKSAGTVLVASAEKPKLKGKHIWVRQLGVFPSLFSFDPVRLITPGGSSLYAAMQLGYFMGIRKFLLYGTDFQFAFERQLGTTDPFRTAKGEGNHFIPNYRGGRSWSPPSLRNIALSFFAARLLLEANGGFIRNASRGGAMEIFDRVNFDEALVADFWAL